MEKETNSFSQGLRQHACCLGYLSVAFAFGIFTVSHGLTAWEAVMISMTNVTRRAVGGGADNRGRRIAV